MTNDVNDNTMAILADNNRNTGRNDDSNTAADNGGGYNNINIAIESSSSKYDTNILINIFFKSSLSSYLFTLVLNCWQTWNEFG